MSKYLFIQRVNYFQTVVKEFSWEGRAVYQDNCQQAEEHCLFAYSFKLRLSCFIGALWVKYICTDIPVLKTVISDNAGVLLCIESHVTRIERRDTPAHSPYDQRDGEAYPVVLSRTT
jgi:hypothetical protein